MIELLKDDLYLLKQLDLPKRNVDIQGYFQGIISGRAWINKKSNPTTAILIVADFCILVGDIDTNEESWIIEILSTNCKGKLIISENLNWHEFIEKNFKEIFKKYKRYSIKREPDVFDKNKLNEYILSLRPKFTPIRIDEKIYYKALEQYWTADFCSNFSSLDNYLKYGVGYVVMKDGEIISGAASYSYCEGAIDITIETKPEYKRQGLALACASKVILECIEKGLYPQWDASNLPSVALAEKLGYNMDKEYWVYFI